MRVAVIGAGSMGKNHARVYHDISEVDLEAIADSNLQVAELIAQRYGARPYQDYRQMLMVEKPQAVSIAVPTALHTQVALDCLEAGAHILLEKPIADTLESGRQIIAQARRLDRFLMIGHILRFNPAIQALKEKIGAGELGRIFQIICRRVGPFPERIRDVGVVLDLATHDLDLMRYLTGLEPERVFAETERRIHTEHEDLLLGLLRFPDGVIGSLEINWLTPTKIRELLVLGERGLYRVNDLNQDFYFYENSRREMELWSPAHTPKEGVSEGRMTRFALGRYEPLKAEIQAFINAIQTDSPVPVSGEDGLIALQMALALVESSKNQQAVRLEDVIG